MLFLMSYSNNQQNITGIFATNVSESEENAGFGIRRPEHDSQLICYQGEVDKLFQLL